MLSNFPELKTERLDLIQIRQSHLDDFFNLFKDERVAKFYNIIPFNEKKEAQLYLDLFEFRFKRKTGIRWGIALKGEESIIGTIGFNNFQKNHSGNLGFDLQFEYWNKGLISEALKEIIKYGFQQLEINRMEADVQLGNIGSEKVLEKLGFRKEGILRDWMYWNGNHYDMTMFSLLKRDFEFEKLKADNPFDSNLIRGGFFQRSQ
ncbi:MAG: GNAT family protein [Algoriphagus sp.]|nr:GNAT family protein [Algoriphagus sp.]